MSTISKPSVDVVIPCYNYGRYLERCVQSVLSQEGVDVRILIIDDLSKDNSVEVAERLVAADKRVNLLKHVVNKGLVETANDGVIDWARAKYTLLLSADDALTAGALRRATSVMEAHPEVGMAYGMALVFAEDREMAPTEDPRSFDYRLITGGEFIKRACTDWCGVASPTALVRTEVQHLVGGLDPRFPHTCDMEIWLRLATCSDVAALSTTQAYYRRHETNMSTAYMDRPLTDLREQLATVEAVLGVWGKDMPGAQEWLTLMKDRIAKQACWMAGLAYERGDRKSGLICLEFARQNDRSIVGSRPWLRAQAKRLLGGGAIRMLRGSKEAKNASYSPFKRGEMFGWWPKFGTQATMTI